jgi:hypothetical protein
MISISYFSKYMQLLADIVPSLLHENSNFLCCCVLKEDVCALSTHSGQAPECTQSLLALSALGQEIPVACPRT